MIECSHLNTFLTAAEEQSFSRAAKRLHLSQSAVSQNTQALERAFGISLFERRGRSIVLSETGQTILPMVRDALNSMRLVEDALLNLNQQVSGELLIGCSTSAGKYILPILLANFQKQYPNVLPRVRIMGREMVLERLLNHVIPFGVTSRVLEHSNLENLPLFEDRIILIVPPNHPWAKFGRALPSDLLDQPLIMREETSGTREAIVEGLRVHGVSCDSIRPCMELGNAEAIEMAVEYGVGIAFVSELVAVRGLREGRVCKVEIEKVNLSRTIYISRHVSRPMTRAQNMFWQYIIDNRPAIQKWVETQSDHVGPNILVKIPGVTLPQE
jgi:DNA-binding transcriptional LysR family regulator